MKKRYSPLDWRMKDNRLFLERCGKRLHEELGINPAGIEVILNMRQEILALQDRLRELEAELSYLHSRRNPSQTRITSVYYEAIWYELDDPGGE